METIFFTFLQQLARHLNCHPSFLLPVFWSDHAEVNYFSYGDHKLQIWYSKEQAISRALTDPHQATSALQRIASPVLIAPWLQLMVVPFPEYWTHTLDFLIHLSLWPQPEAVLQSCVSSTEQQKIQQPRPASTEKHHVLPLIICDYQHSNPMIL